jgi:FAD dependent oxidoreductase
MAVDTPFSQRPIVILGAGIIGCATALQLLQNGFQVTLVGEFLPGDKSILYASAWAGAAWHAAGGITDDQKYIQAVTHRHLLKMAQEDPSSGVCIVNGREYLEQAPGTNSSVWGEKVLKNVCLSPPHSVDDQTNNRASSSAHSNPVNTQPTSPRHGSMSASWSIPRCTCPG